MKPASAKRLVGSLVIPEQVGLILENPQFRDPTVILALIERIDELTRTAPQAAVAAAEATDALLARVRSVNPDKVGVSLETRARVALASALRTVGRLAEAEVVYRELLQRADRIPRLEQALILRRFAVALTDQRRYQEALETAEQALALHREMRAGEGQALVIRGGVHLERGAYGQAMSDFTEALHKLTPTAEWPHYMACIMALATCAVRSCPPEQIGEAIARVRRARRACRLPSWSVPSLKLRWIEGLLHWRLGSTRKAEASLTDARVGLLEVGCSQDAALVTLDLAGLLIEEGRTAEARAVATEALRLSTLSGSEVDALGALKTWCEGTGELKTETLRAARALMLGRLGGQDAGSITKG